jgi:hypothetical protein
MATVVLSLDEELNAALDMLSLQQGCDKETLLADIVRRYVQNERLRQALSDPKLVSLYQELEAEERALAEEGMADYQRMLDEADRP